MTPSELAELGEDPSAVPVCSLGDIAPGSSAVYTITVQVDLATSGLITNTASVEAVGVRSTVLTSAAVDPDVRTNVVTESTLITGVGTVIIAKN